MPGDERRNATRGSPVSLEPGPVASLSPPRVHGSADARFARVRDAFAHNQAADDAAGASVCVYFRGQKMVDLWGGVNPLTHQAWTGDTVTTIFSATKAATALCAHLLAQRGLLDYDAPVARYWPEFAAAGKSMMPVRWLLSHKSGLPSPDAAFQLRIEDYADWDRMVAALASQRPWWEPGAHAYYHAITFGFLVGEVVRRVSGMTVGQFFAREVARPLGLNFWIGMDRTFDSLYAPGILPANGTDAYWAGVPEPERPQPGAPARTPIDVIRRLGLDPDSTAAQVPWVRAQLLMPDATGIPGSEFFNSRAFRAAEIPASSGVANARALAKMYAACIGEVDGVCLLRPETVKALRRCETDGVSAPPQNIVLGRGVSPRLGLGFQLPTPVMPLLGEGSFGHHGAGGRLGFAHPELGVAFGYVSARIWRDHTGADPRWTRLCDALRESMQAISS